MTRFFIFLFAVYYSIHPLAFAAPKTKKPPKTSKAAAQVELSQPQSLDKLRQRLPKVYASKTAKGINLSYQKLDQKKYTQAIQFASKYLTDPIFADYAQWITASSNLGLAMELLKKKAYSKAIPFAQKAIASSAIIGERYPYSPFIKGLMKDIAQAELALGDAHWGLKKWAQAENYMERGFQRLQVTNGMLFISQSNLNHYFESCKKRPSDFCMNWAQKFADTFLKKPEELKNLLSVYPLLSEQAKPIRASSKSTFTYKAPDLDQVAYDEAMKFYFDGKNSKTVKALRQFGDDYPRSAHRYRARFWLGQSLLKDGEKEKSQKIFQDLQVESIYSYFGLASSFQTGKPIEQALSYESPLAQETDVGLLPIESLKLKRARHFVAEKAYDLAGYELKDFRARDTHSSPFLMYMAMLNTQAKNYLGSFQIITELLQRGADSVYTTEFASMIFPVEYYKIIQHYSQLNDLDPILVLSLIKQESAFDESANSYVGAVGLMQLMPATALETDPSVALDTLTDPDASVKVGTQYLKKMLVRFKGNIALALAAYNAGPYAVQRWLKELGTGKDLEEFIERIPYRETRDYVGSIIRNYYWYSKQINHNTLKDLKMFWNNKMDLDIKATPSPEVPRPIPAGPTTVENPAAQARPKS